MLNEHSRHWALTLKWMSLAGMAVLTGALIWLSLDPATLIATARDDLQIPAGPWHSGALVQALIVGFFWLQGAAGLWILWEMAQLFDTYAKGGALSARAARHIGRIGAAMVTRAVLMLLAAPLQSLALSIRADKGAGMLSVSLDAQTMMVLLTGGLMVMIGTTMTQAVQIARENEGFV